MTGIALDLGTKTGYAMTCGMVLAAGTWTLASPVLIKSEAKLRMDRRLDIRIPRLYHALKNSHNAKPLDWVFFEDVQFSSTTKQTQLWASLRAAVWMFAHEHNVKIECCPVGTLKKFATGYGGATKDQMRGAAQLKYPDLLREYSTSTLDKGGTTSTVRLHLDDNAIDAIHLLAWGIQTVSRGK